MHTLCYHPCLQASDTLSTAEALLGDLAGFQAFRREAAELKDELYGHQREQFEGWSRHVLAAIDHPTNPLRYMLASFVRRLTRAN